MYIPAMDIAAPSLEGLGIPHSQAPALKLWERAQVTKLTAWQNRFLAGFRPDDIVLTYGRGSIMSTVVWGKAPRYYDRDNDERVEEELLGRVLVQSV